MTKIKLRYVDCFQDRLGKERYYFHRRIGHEVLFSKRRHVVCGVLFFNFARGCAGTITWAHRCCACTAVGNTGQRRAVCRDWR